MKKIISLMLTAALVMTSGGSVVFAKEDVSKEPPASATSVHPEQMQSGLEPLEADEEIDPEQIITAIIELDDEPLIVKAEEMKDVDVYSAKNRASLLSKQKSVQSKISRKVLDGKGMDVIRSYTVTTNGFAAKIPYGKLEEIRKIDGVSAAYAAPVFKVSPDMQSSLSVLGGMENTSGYNGEGTVIAIVDSGLETTHEAFRSSPSSPSLAQDDITAVLQKNDLHAEESVNGLTAAQVYHNAKIPFAFDYADNDTNVTPGSAGDHGTHVAGIAAANAGVQSDVAGVASQAQILALKVFSSEATNGATWDDILAALDDAVCLGADVINMSLGSTAGFASTDADEGVSAVYQRVTDAGIMLAVAGGNEYSSAFGNKMGKGHALTQNPDYGTIASPSSYNASMAVASVDKADVIQSYYLTAGARKIAFNDTAEDTTVSGVDENSVRFRSLSGKQLDYAVIPGYGETKDYNDIDVTGKIALVSRGSVDYETKKKAAKNAGAAGIIVYNNEPGMLYMQLDSYDFPSAFISQADGQWLCDQAGNVKLNISNSQGSIDSPTSGQMSDFSSWGVTPELTLKPDITAPGGNIRSTITGNSYGTKSGTSMASPYVAGAMAVVKEYIEQKHSPEVSSETSKADLVNSVLMSTADIVYEENGTPYSPRKQGAGSVNVDRAVRSSAYATVPGKKLPKIELGDDVKKTGVYTMSVDVHNYSEKAITYKVGGTVQTDGAEVTKQYNGKDVWQTTERPYKLEATVSGSDVTVNAGQTVNVPVTVTLTAADKAYMDSHFENGIYVEGFITLTPEANDDVTLSVPYMGFYGDWTRASVIDRGYYWNDIDGEENWATQYTNTAGVSSLEGYVTNYLGDNPYHKNVKYLADRNAISPNNDDTMDALDILYTGLLRNVKQLKYTITGEDGTVYYEKDVDYEIKSVYSSSYYRIVPSGVEDYSKMDAWYGTDKNGKTLANGTKATVKIECELPYDKHAANNEALSWEFPITVDTEEPTAEDITVREENGAYYVSMKVRDNEYVSNVCFANAAGDTQLGSYPIAETEAGKTSEVEYNVTGYGEKLTLVINDYAGNRKEYKVNVEGNTDDSEVIIPTKSIFNEDFEEDKFPDNGWTVRSQSSTTWKQASEYGTKLALCDFAKDDQDEWLISPEIDLASQETKASMIFDFWTNYYWSVQNHRHNLKVKASKDGGNTWTDIWQLWDVTKEFEAWTRTQAKVNIPEEFQNASNVQFALVYEGSDSTEVALDNVNIYVEDPQATHTVTATAGEGGTITPSGKVKISDGKSKEFKITPDEGNAVRDVKVDGESVGAVTSYKFENVTEDHTIEAEFAASGTAGTAEVIIDEDFDNLTSGGALPDGWTLKTTNSSYTWKLYKYQSKSMGLYCSADTYDPDSGSGGWWSVNSDSDNSVSLKNGDKQDERMILPAADLSGGASELSYQFTGNTSLLKKGSMTCTVEVSNDGGATWTELWNGKDAVDSMQDGVISSFVGTADITLKIPENLRSSSTQISFRYQRPALSENGGPVFIDNVKLTATKAAPAGRKTVLDEDFEGQKMPDGWTTSITNKSYTWKIYKAFSHWLAYCSADTYDPDDYGGWSIESTDKRDISVKNGDKQDERLITPALDLSGGNADLQFQFSAVSRLIKNSKMTCTAEASTDGGATWTEIWNASSAVDDMKTGTLNNALGTAEVKVSIPEELQTANTLISFRYQSKAYNQDNGPIYVDNVKVETDNGGSKPSPEPTAFTVTASAGQGGNISPSGAQTVNKGDDIEFTINASENYKIADVLVDGESAGAVTSYKFENVTKDHTISASFEKTEIELPDSIHEDFNASQMPEGWSVEGPSKTYNYETWKLGRYSSLNNSNTAICSQNIMFKQEQNEKLIMPQIKMADSMKLTFDFGGSYNELVSGSVKLTVKATLNKGATWTEIWNAKEHIQTVDDDSDAPEDITGNGSIMIPAEYCSDNARFAFVFESNDRRNATVAVDNVVLEKSDAAPSDMYAVVIAETENGTVKADKTLAAQGTQINLTVIPDEGYKLKEGSLRANGEEVKNNTFTMPAENVTVTATFEKNGEVETEPGSYKDGIYRGSAKGFNGRVTVDVTVENGRISKIETVEQSETESFWEKALAMIEKLIGLGDDQSVSNVDTVSGATVSSEAIQAAVLDALKNAKDTDSGIFASGSGTKQDPYIVRTITQMKDLAESVNGGETYEGKYIALGNNISAEGITWIPIGTADHGKYNSFRGIFDGRGYTISDVTCGTASDSQSLEVMGIFGALGNGAVVKNLNVYIEKFYNSISTEGFDAAVGGVAGIVGKNAVIDHCTVSGGANALSSVESNVNSYSVGGIAGRMESGSMIADSWSDIGISDGSLEMDADMKHYVGGICGKQGNDSLIANCASFGLAAVSVGDGNIHVGGIVGETSGALYNCYSMSSTRGNNIVNSSANPTTAVGMLAGNTTNEKALYNCYYYVNANQVIDFTDQASDEEEGKPERRKVVGYDSADKVEADLSNVTGLSANKLASDDFADTLNEGRKKASKSAADEYFGSISVSDREDMLDNGYLSWSLTGDRVLIDGTQIKEQILESVELLRQIKVPYGTKESDLDLPATVTAKFTDGGSGSFAVSWSCSSYDANKAGDYTFEGTLTMISGVNNPKDIKAYQVVTVEPSGTAADEYALTVNGGKIVTDGTAGVSSGKYTAGTSITVKADDPASGKEFNGWTASGVTLENASNTSVTFTMPANAVVLTANWKDKNNSGGSGGSGGGGGGSSSSSNITVTKPENGTITSSPSYPSEGSTVTITVKPDNGYTTDKVTATDSKGNDLEVIKLADGKYAFIMPSGKVSVSVSFKKSGSDAGNKMPFGDVKEGTYYYDPVIWAVDNNITQGAAAALFMPELDCTRAQVVTFLWRAAGSPAPEDKKLTFKDVDKDAYYYDAVRWAAQNGITQGTSESTFSPNATVTRAQFVTFMWRSEKTPDALSKNVFRDLNKDSYYYDAVLWAAQEGITSGTSADRFSPENSCTRGQVVTFLNRLFDKNESKNK